MVFPREFKFGEDTFGVLISIESVLILTEGITFLFILEFNLKLDKLLFIKYKYPSVITIKINMYRE